MDKRRFVKIVVILFLLAIVGLVVILLVFNRSPEIEESVVPVKTVKPILGDIEQVYVISGYIESEAMVQVHSKVSGNIRKFYVGVSDRVEEDGLLLKIDDSPYLTQLKGYREAFLVAKSTFSRVKNLYEGGAAALQDYEKAKAEYEAYKAKFDYANMEYSWTKVRSPIKGTVLQKYVSTGQIVSPEVALLIIADLDNLIIKAKIPEDNYSTFVKGERILLLG